LVRLTRITVDLNRITQARHQRTEQLSSERRPQANDQPAAEPDRIELSDEAYHSIRNALRDNSPLAPQSPPPEPNETPAGATQPVSMAPAEAQQSADLTTLPQLTADSRSYPHPKLDRVVPDAVTDPIWSSAALPSIENLHENSEQDGAA
jgi:hypothetical protein